MPKVIDVESLQGEINSKLEEIRSIASEAMKNNGLTGDECQKAALDNALFEVEKVVNGIESNDIMDEDEGEK